MKSVTIKRNLAVLLAVCLVSINVVAQQTLSLQNCRDMALENNNNIKIHEEKVKMADYDKKIAFSNYLPKISAEGAPWTQRQWTASGPRMTPFAGSCQAPRIVAPLPVASST